VRVATTGHERLVAALGRAGHDVVVLEVPPAHDGAAGELSAALVDFERRLGAGEADAAAVRGDEDAQVALALVATKLEFPLLRLPGEEGETESPLGRVLALLADDAITA
jgi:hypothetical protein